MKDLSKEDILLQLGRNKKITFRSVVLYILYREKRKWSGLQGILIGFWRKGKRKAVGVVGNC